MKRSIHSRRPRRSVRGAGVLLFVLLFAAGCIDSGRETGPGFQGETVTLQARIESPKGPEGAVLLDVSRDEVLRVRSTDDRTVVLGRNVGERSQIAIVRDFPGTIEFEVLAADGPALPEIHVLQVADWENRLRDDVTGYTVEMRR
ncbi:MAG: hypothetical protein GWM92_12700 [Gemmatimonadetes bacterium]|nr:hypothetical protein [Gemmatimonadota bacterium]NIR78687.1 hypothetical protein [Gemmatimonadota bacterium]NIT88238.1 hypothetical protein [Gemmatimonadota bacterium]NIU31323.1 hypothetical protein [Gemmatimonadota bacterium]NIU36021.1 hypothetical protein [Gemmatimonadota bacterium]